MAQEVPNVKAVGGRREAVDFHGMACPLLERKKMYRGMMDAKCTNGAVKAAIFDLLKKTEMKKPERGVF